MNVKNRANLTLAILASTLVGAGACTPRSGVQRPSATYRAAAIVTFRTMQEMDDAFAVPEIEVAAWSNAAWTIVPPSESTSFTAYTLRPSAAPPVLFFARRTSRWGVDLGLCTDHHVADATD